MTNMGVKLELSRKFVLYPVALR